jgi:cobalt-zinc-cadmium efflux system outer membrane protein
MQSKAVIIFFLGSLAVKSALAQEVVPAPVELPATVTLAQALDIFRAKGLDLLIAEAGIQSAEGDLRAAGAIPNPSLSLSYGYSYYRTACNSATQACTIPPALSVGLSDQNALEDTLSGKRSLRKDVAAAALRAARLSRVDAERNLLFQVKQQFAIALLSRESLKFAIEVAEMNTKMLDLMEARNNAGAVSDADVLRVKTAKLEADQAVDQAKQNERTAKVSLAFLLGVRKAVPNFDVNQPDLLQSSLTSSLSELRRDILIEQALRSRPDLLVQRAQVERADSALALAKRLRFPDIAINASYTQQGVNPAAITPPTFLFGLTAPIPVLYQQQGEILKALSDRSIEELQEAKLEAQVLSDVENAYATFVGTQALVQRMEIGTLLDSAKRARDLVLIQFQKGAASLLDYLTAQQQFIATRVEYLNDLNSYWTAVFGLERAVGRDLR